jgi:hypothetical protein
MRRANVVIRIPTRPMDHDDERFNAEVPSPRLLVLAVEGSHGRQVGQFGRVWCDWKPMNLLENTLFERAEAISRKPVGCICFGSIILVTEQLRAVVGCGSNANESFATSRHSTCAVVCTADANGAIMSGHAAKRATEGRAAGVSFRADAGRIRVARMPRLGWPSQEKQGCQKQTGHTIERSSHHLAPIAGLLGALRLVLSNRSSSSTGMKEGTINNRRKDSVACDELFCGIDYSHARRGTARCS